MAARLLKERRDKHFIKPSPSTFAYLVRTDCLTKKKSRGHSTEGQGGLAGINGSNIYSELIFVKQEGMEAGSGNFGSALTENRPHAQPRRTLAAGAAIAISRGCRHAGRRDVVIGVPVVKYRMQELKFFRAGTSDKSCFTNKDRNWGVREGANTPDP
jgi:hypothetical protein